MSERKYTPGPWFDWESREWLYEPSKLLTNYGDACLMASAPEMFAALKLLLSSAHDYQTGIAEAEEAIAAAEGRTP